MVSGHQTVFRRFRSGGRAARHIAAHHGPITGLSPRSRRRWRAWCALGPCVRDCLLLITPAMTPILPWLAAAAEGAAHASARPRSEAQLVLPDLKQVHMLGTTGWN